MTVRLSAGGKAEPHFGLAAWQGSWIKPKQTNIESWKSKFAMCRAYNAVDEEIKCLIGTPWNLSYRVISPWILLPHKKKVGMAKKQDPRGGEKCLLPINCFQSDALSMYGTSVLIILSTGSYTRQNCLSSRFCNRRPGVRPHWLWMVLLVSQGAAPA